MTYDRLMWHLENWRDWMQIWEDKLGWPSKSLCMISGGASCAEEFDIMCEEVDIHCAEAFNSLVDSLSKPRRIAIEHVWLGVAHHYPTQELDYEEALGALLILAEKRKFD